MRFKTLLLTASVAGVGIVAISAYRGAGLPAATVGNPALAPNSAHPTSATPSERYQDAADDTAIEHARKHANNAYVCPMHPQIIQDQPGNCPICGMKLELRPVAGDATSVAAAQTGLPIVAVRPEVVQNMGVRTARAERGVLVKRIETVGAVAYDEKRMNHVHPRASGWVEKLAVRAEGERVERGQPLFYLYSPDIVNAQAGYVQALAGLATTGEVQGRSLVQSAERRLQLLEVPPALINNLAKTRQAQETIPAPTSGVVMKLSVREGMYVEPALELFDITDVSSVWVQADVFEHQAGWVAVGQPAAIKVAAFPERDWKGEVDYVYPQLDPVTRTLKVRLRFNNPDGALKPNMFARAVIDAAPKDNAITVPRDALIVTGRGERVVLALGAGRFQPVTVTSGIQAQDRVEILSGLNENQEVVVSGQFLLDSESNLQASFRRMQPLATPQQTRAPAAPAVARTP